MVWIFPYKSARGTLTVMSVVAFPPPEAGIVAVSTQRHVRMPPLHESGQTALMLMLMPMAAGSWMDLTIAYPNQESRAHACGRCRAPSLRDAELS
jgi:hypothetical protein